MSSWPRPPMMAESHWKMPRRSRRAVGQRGEPEIDIAHEANVTLADRLAADLRALLLDELRKLVAIGRAEPLDAGKLDGLALDLERASVDDLIHRAGQRYRLRLGRQRHWLGCGGGLGRLFRRDVDRRHRRWLRLRRHRRHGHLRLVGRSWDARYGLGRVSRNLLRGRRLLRDPRLD